MSLTSRIYSISSGEQKWAYNFSMKLILIFLPVLETELRASFYHLSHDSSPFAFVFQRGNCTNFVRAGLQSQSYRQLPSSWDHRHATSRSAKAHILNNIFASLILFLAPRQPSYNKASHGFYICPKSTTDRNYLGKILLLFLNNTV
jgi:hypothetical protein